MEDLIEYIDNGQTAYEGEDYLSDALIKAGVSSSDLKQMKADFLNKDFFSEVKHS